MGVQNGKLLGIARKGKPHAEMETLDSVEIGVEFGLKGDWRGPSVDGPLFGRQVSVMSIEDWNATCGDAGGDLPWTVRRANLLVEGLALKETAGARIRIGDVVLRVHQETDPCSRMDAQHQGLTDALMPDWRGGVCCLVESGGSIALNDAVEMGDAEDQP